MLSSHLLLRLPSGGFPRDIPTKFCTHFICPHPTYMCNAPEPPTSHYPNNKATRILYNLRIA
jgi:hypothetical protein